MKQYIKARLSSIQSLSIKTCQKLRSINPIYQIIIGVALLAIIIASKFLFGHRHSPESKVVEIYKASKGNMLQTTRLLGRIEASKLFTSTAGYEGTISYIAPAGSTLKAGEIIAKIQNDPIEAAYHSSIHTVEIATAQYNRQLMLFNSKTASRQTVEDKFSNLSVAKNALVAAQINYDKIVFVAPFDGIVGSAIMHVGSRAKPGDSIVTFYDPSEFIVKFDIASDYIKSLAPDAHVSINNKEYKIDFIQRVLSNQAYTAPAHVHFPCDTCISGEMVNVDLHLNNKKDIIIVPTSCIFIQNKKNFVYKIVDGKAQISPVKLGITAHDQIEVTEGIVEGDEIVLKGQSRLYPGIDVKVHKDEKIE